MESYSQLGLNAEDDLCIASLRNMNNLLSCFPRADRCERERIEQIEQGVLDPVLTFEKGIRRRASTHKPRNDCQDMNAFLCQFGMQSFGEAHLRKLGAGVWQQVGYTHLTADRSDIYNMAALTLYHRWKHGQGWVETAPEHHSHRLLKIFECLCLQRTHRDDTRVVDEHINLSKMGSRLIHHSLYLLTVSDIAWYRQYFRSHGHNLSPRPFQFRLIASAQYQPGSMPRKLFSQRQPQAT